jgi:SAM-dependent methyltransferase
LAAHSLTFLLLLLPVHPTLLSPTTAAKLEEVFGEVFRVLKPGGVFLSYEWVSTKTFNPNDAEHVRIIDEINFGNGLPEMRTYKQAEEAGGWCRGGAGVEQQMTPP